MRDTVIFKQEKGVERIKMGFFSALGAGPRRERIQACYSSPRFKKCI